MARGVMASKILVDKLTLSRLRKEIMPSTLLLIPLDFLNFLRPWKIYTLVHTRFLSAFWENRGKMRQKTCVAQPFWGDTENYVDKYLTIWAFLMDIVFMRFSIAAKVRLCLAVSRWPVKKAKRWHQVKLPNRKIWQTFFYMEHLTIQLQVRKSKKLKF